jgi:peptidoglycan hydrolase-like protein with peptidoglycan-binding domain
MKKINEILTFVFFVSAMLVAGTVSAATEAELRAELNALQGKAADLQKVADQNGVSTGATVKYYNFGTVTLKNGSKGEAVKELQRFLNAKLKLGLVVDGKLGPKTIAVIKTWQKEHGLVADGLIGVKTKLMMNSAN